MRNSYSDGRWAFEEIGLPFNGGTAGNFSGYVDVEDGEISTIWVLRNEDDRPYPVERGSYLHDGLLPQIISDLPAMIEWQSGARANFTAYSRVAP